MDRSTRPGTQQRTRKGDGSPTRIRVLRNCLTLSLLSTMSPKLLSCLARSTVHLSGPRPPANFTSRRPRRGRQPPRRAGDKHVSGEGERTSSFSSPHVEHSLSLHNHTPKHRHRANGRSPVARWSVSMTSSQDLRKSPDAVCPNNLQKRVSLILFERERGKEGGREGGGQICGSRNKSNYGR